MLPVKIAGLGWYLPERRVTNTELEEQLGIPADWIERVTGVHERRYVTNETAVSMGVAAAQMALEDATHHLHFSHPILPPLYPSVTK
jgi:3-oxoacyl-[acyl-carrier-protein] synthase-3